MSSVAPRTAPKRSILIVEDHAHTRRLLAEWLSSVFPGLIACEARSGEDALASIHQQCLDVVLMDVRLPGIDGIETTRRLRALRPQLCIVFLTNHDQPHYQRAAAAAGARGFVLKRTMHRDLVPLLSDLLDVQGEPS